MAQRKGVAAPAGDLGWGPAVAPGVAEAASRIVAELTCTSPAAAGAPATGPCLVLGVGNPDSAADRVGREVVRRVRAALPAPEVRGGVEVRELSGSAFEILDAWGGYDRVVLVDACRGGGPPGALHRFDAAAAPLPAALGSPSSHGWGVAEAVELGRALGRLPRELVVWGVEAARER